jgi:2-polyprenyl-6-methoxyphenol hydroxylase-like FAD-dependent oxidoreductase
MMRFRHYAIYRPDLQRILAARLEQLGVTIRFGARVKTLDCEMGMVWLEDGSDVTGDLVVCADGNAPAS